MKRGYIWTFIKTLFIILIIVAIIVFAAKFLQKEVKQEEVETIKTYMLLIEGKTKVVAEKVRIKEKGAEYVGTEISEVANEQYVKELQDKGIIDIDSKDKKYYVLDNEALESLELGNVELQDGCYIVEYKNNDIIYSKGVKDTDGNIKYKLSEFEGTKEKEESENEVANKTETKTETKTKTKKKTDKKTEKTKNTKTNEGKSK